MNIQWNTVTWYSKLLAVVFFIGILPIWTFYIGTQYEETVHVVEKTSQDNSVIPVSPQKNTITHPTAASLTTDTDSSTTPPVTIVGWKKYSSSQYSFEIQYPSFIKEMKDSDYGEGGVVGFIPLCEKGQQNVCLFYAPPNMQHVNNFEGAAVTVTTYSGQMNKQECEDFYAIADTAPTTTYATNGITFYSNDFGDGATGHEQQGTEYRTFHNSQCYSIKEAINTYRCDGTQTKNSKTGVTYCDGSPEADTHVIANQLMQVISTFKFLK